MTQEPSWFTEFIGNLSKVQNKSVVPETAPNPQEYIKELEARINQKDMEIDSLLLDVERLQNIVKVNNVKIYKLRRDAL